MGEPVTRAEAALHVAPQGAFDAVDPPDWEGILDCVHCGICLPQCPTYRVLGQEMDSPRGRLYLMRAAAEGRIGLTPTLARHLDLCLGCRGCEGACPSGGPFGSLSAMEALLPRLASAGAAALPEVTPPSGEPRGRAGLLVGCVQRHFFPEVNAQTLRLLAAAGYEVVVPREQGCCGALHLHSGRLDDFRGMARQLMRAFPADVDVVVANAAGCGSALKEYGHWLHEPEAEAFSQKVRDISEVLADADLPLGAVPVGGPHQEACPPAAGQKVRAEPRALLGRIPGLRLVEMADSDLCCGSAGVYNLLEPGMA